MHPSITSEASPSAPQPLHIAQQVVRSNYALLSSGALRTLLGRLPCAKLAPYHSCPCLLCRPPPATLPCPHLRPNSRCKPHPHATSLLVLSSPLRSPDVTWLTRADDRPIGPPLDGRRRVSHTRRPSPSNPTRSRTRDDSNRCIVSRRPRSRAWTATGRARLSNGHRVRRAWSES